MFLAHACQAQPCGEPGLPPGHSLAHKRPSRSRLFHFCPQILVLQLPQLVHLVGMHDRLLCVIPCYHLLVRP